MKTSKSIRKNLITILIATGTVALAACASSGAKSDSEMDQKVSTQAPANTPEQIRDRAAETFANSQGLNPEQKAKLTVIYQKTYGEAMTIRKDIGQSKSLLFEMIATKDYKSKEVEALKQRIIALDYKRLDVMFKAMADVQAVVGFGKGTEDIYKHLRDYEMPRPGRMMTDY